MTERIVARDDTGTVVEFDLTIDRRVFFVVDCNCWNHRGGFEFELITTPGSAYVRRVGEGHFRPTDASGPITMHVRRVERVD